MLNHGTGINRVSSKLSPRTANYHLREAFTRARRCHACSASVYALTLIVRWLSNAQGLSANYRDVLRRYWRWWIRYWQLITRRGNVLYWSISCANRAARTRCTKSCLRTRTQVHTHIQALNMYLNVVRCLSIKLLVHECRWIAPEPDGARMEMSKFSTRRKQSKHAPLTSGGISRFRESRQVKLHILRTRWLSW